MDNSKTPIYMRPRIDFSNGHGRDLLGLIKTGTSYVLFVDPRGNPTEDSIPYAKNILGFDGATLHAEEIGTITFQAEKPGELININYKTETRIPIGYAPTCYTDQDIQEYLERTLIEARQPLSTIEQIVEQI